MKGERGNPLGEQGLTKAESILLDIAPPIDRAARPLAEQCLTNGYHNVPKIGKFILAGGWN